ncbi:hypothetical protein SM139_0037 [Stenotrophomonas maltophilia]|nr:hypothetical protein SM139_0037 [Stenotrophomonas maltophilia]
MVKVSPMTSGVAAAGDADSAAISGAAETTDNNSDSTIRRMGRPILGKMPSIDRRRHCRSRHFADLPELEHHGAGDGHATGTLAQGLVAATLISTRRFPC